MAATCYQPGMNLFELLGVLSDMISGYPLSIRWTAYTPRFLLGALVVYAFAVLLYLSTRENRRPGEEHGSAKWGDPRTLGEKYRDKKHPAANMILTQNVQMGLDSRRHRRNLNILVVGGSGAGKTRFFAKPNVMQANTSYLITDPKGELARAVAPLLIRQGYDVRIFDLLDTALILYLMHEAPRSEQNFAMVMYMIENGGAREDDDDFQSPLDLLFEALEDEESDHIAVKQYKIFKQAASKTAKSILISAAVRLAAFNLPEIARITETDTLDLGSLGDSKRAIFCCIPDNDTSFNYIVGMLYTQAFQSLYYTAGKVHGGRLPVHVRCIFDEFANGATRS